MDGDPPRENGGMLPEPVPGFVGRERELAAMHAALAHAESNRSRLMLVTGEPGIGKSALVDAFAAQAGARGARVLWGAAWEDSGSPAYWPWVQILRAVAPELERQGPARSLAPLETLLPGLAGEAADTSHAERDRFTLFDAVVRALELTSRAAPLVVVIEDLHAAGLPSTLLLQFAAQHIRSAPVLFVATYRDVEARLTPGLSDIVAEMEGSGTILAVPPMTEPEVRELVTPVMSDMTPDLLAAILERTRGNPLFVAQVAQLLRQDSAGSARPSAVPIPAGIRQAVHQRLALLGGPAELPRTALMVSAALGGEVDPGEVSAVLDTPVVELLEALAAAIRSGLLVELGPQRYRFGHALVREAIYGELGSKERATLHYRVATTLAKRSPRPGDHARLAHHFHAALPAGEAEPAVHHARAAGQEAMAALAYEEAVGLFQQALSALHHTTGETTPQRCELLLSLGAALVTAGDLGRAQPVLVQATEHARRCGDAELLGRAALLRTKHLEFQTVDHQAIALLEEAAGALEGADSSTLAQVYAQLGFARQHGEPERMAAAADRAIEVAHRCGDRAALAAAMSMRLYTQWGRHEPRSALSDAEELTRLVEQTDDAELTVTACMWRFTFSLELGEPAGAQAALDRVTELAERSHQPILRHLATSRASTLAVLTGRFDDALACADEALQIGVQAGLPDAEPVYWNQLFAVSRFIGLPAEHETRMERILRDIVARAEFPVTHQAALVLVECSHGARAEAARRLERLVERVPGLRHDGLYVWTLAMLAEGCTTLGMTDHADSLYAALLPFAGRFVVASGVICMGAVQHYLGGLAMLAGRPDDAERHYRAAVEHHGRVGAEPMLARSRREYEQLHQRGPEPREALGAGAVPGGTFRRSGRTWQVEWDGVAATVPDSKGMRDLGVLLAAPNREVSALDLVEAAGGPAAAAAGGHAGERLDVTARTAYRTRLAELEGELAEAEGNADAGQVDALRREQEFLAEELAGALGLGGRARTDRDPVERARKAVGMRIRTALRAIAEVNPGLARHLDQSVTTGRFCAYGPEYPVRWRL